MKWLKRYWELCSVLDYNTSTKEKLEIMQGYQDNLYYKVRRGVIAFERKKQGKPWTFTCDVSKEVYEALEAADGKNTLSDECDAILRLLERECIEVGRAFSGELVDGEKILGGLFHFLLRSNPKLIENGRTGLFPNVIAVKNYEKEGNVFADMYLHLTSEWCLHKGVG